MSVVEGLRRHFGCCSMTGASIRPVTIRGLSSQGGRRASPRSSLIAAQCEPALPKERAAKRHWTAWKYRMLVSALQPDTPTIRHCPTLLRRGNCNLVLDSHIRCAHARRAHQALQSTGDQTSRVERIYAPPVNCTPRAPCRSVVVIFWPGPLPSS